MDISKKKSIKYKSKDFGSHDKKTLFESPLFPSINDMVLLCIVGKT